MYKHGIYFSEIPTSIVPPSRTSAGLPVVVGTAPINLATNGYKVNEPVLCYTYDEAVANFGFVKDYENYTLCEFIRSHFTLYSVAPVVLINVLDPSIHKTDVTSESLSLIADIGLINATGILKETVVVKSDDETTTYQEGIDYTLAFNDDGKLVLTRKKDGTIPQGTITLKVSYTKLDPSKVTSNDIIGGIDITTGKAKGFELVNQVFPKFGLVPGLLLAPYWSTKPEVAAVMDAKAQNINGHFKALALVDIPTDVVKKYSDVPAWKNSNNYTSKYQVSCWPMIKLGDEIFHLSTHIAGVICGTDANNEDIPYMSPSNHNLKASAAVLKDGEEIFLGPDQAAYLNGEGIVTAINIAGGWKVWGNRTGCYPTITDPKDSFIPIRRMTNWIGNVLTLTFWQKIDYPINRRLIETIVDSANIWFNGLVARQFILGGKVVLLKEENPETDLMDGIIKFHVYFASPSPAREIDFILEYDVKYLENLFA
ncbi:phage tail sheath family protein [Caloramator australicus]|uniref:Bacteriophage tail sheath protein n=1 Tax=Caloramator australicus RC3 TaxID=857293 RepID=I7LG02_9CLOT|nr:phage tail sheath family protein [Caloramator australicus]CCJ32890.1 bacteriophage tail sheath protein [Caloramator australicus RC3]